MKFIFSRFWRMETVDSAMNLGEGADGAIPLQNFGARTAPGGHIFAHKFRQDFLFLPALVMPNFLYCVDTIKDFKIVLSVLLRQCMPCCC